MAIRVVGRVRWAALGVALLFAGAVALWAWVYLDSGIRTVSDASRAAGDHPLSFTVPDGYVAELVAGPPLVLHPMYISFDDDGRLYVAGFSDRGSMDHPDVIRRLEDLDGDGNFDRSILFASDLSYPEGVLWHDGAVYVASPPGLWRLEDTDGDGWADRRQELLTGFPATGIADDLHGPSVGPDGRLYFGVGRFRYEIRRPGGEIIRRGQSPLVMRSRTDGTEAEVVSSGLGNPVAVDFTAEGEAIACGTFFAPTSMGEDARDAIIHCIQGGIFPVRDRVLHEDPSTGELLAPLVHLGVAAPSGLRRARGAPSDDEGGLVFYSALFNMHKVQRHRLKRDGASFQSRNEDFLVSAEPDFHPTDVLEDADGSLLVVDTGGWFRHCPTSQLDKPDVHGAIYRIRRRDSPRVDDPRGLRLDWSTTDPAELSRRLDDPRPAVRDRACDRLARLQEAAVPALADVAQGGSPSVQGRRTALWALGRIEGASARAAIRTALRDPDASVRLVAATAAGLLRDAGALGALAELARGNGDPAVRREAATALGRIRSPEGVAALLDGLRAGGDRFLEHAQIFALISIRSPEATLKGLDDTSTTVRRGALIALDQMTGGGLTPERVVPFLESSDLALRDAALRVTASRPAWADHFATVLRPWLSRDPLPAKDARFLRAVLPTIAPATSIQDLVSAALRSEATPVETRLLLLEAIGRVKLTRLPKAWIAALETNLESQDIRAIRQATATIRALHGTDFHEPLLRIAHDTSRPTDLRLEAFEAAAPHGSTLTRDEFEFLIDRLKRDEPPLVRMAAARCLGTVPLDAGQLDALCDVIAHAGAIILPRLLPAFQRSRDAATGAHLIAALARAPGLRSLSTQDLNEALHGYPTEVWDQAKALFRRIDLKDGDKSARLAEVTPALAWGSPERGREVFFGARAACSSCHSVRGQGGHVGPDLTRIGAIRTGRDLLEAILFPSASFARGFEPFRVATTNGETLTGVMAQESAEEIVLVMPRGVEFRLSRSSIEVIRPARESIMPRGLEANISRDELCDLVAFLSSRK
jgi:putative heme-binding domain-containing protein